MAENILLSDEEICIIRYMSLAKYISISWTVRGSNVVIFMKIETTRNLNLIMKKKELKYLTRIINQWEDILMRRQTIKLFNCCLWKYAITRTHNVNRYVRERKFGFYEELGWPNKWSNRHYIYGLRCIWLIFNKQSLF